MTHLQQIMPRTSCRFVQLGKVTFRFVRQPMSCGLAALSSVGQVWRLNKMQVGILHTVFRLFQVSVHCFSRTVIVYRCKLTWFLASGCMCNAGLPTKAMHPMKILIKLKYTQKNWQLFSIWICLFFINNLTVLLYFHRTNNLKVFWLVRQYKIQVNVEEVRLYSNTIFVCFFNKWCCWLLK